MKTVWELSPTGQRVKKVKMSNNQWDRVSRSKLAHRFQLELKASKGKSLPKSFDEEQTSQKKT